MQYRIRTYFSVLVKYVCMQGSLDVPDEGVVVKALIGVNSEYMTRVLAEVTEVDHYAVSLEVIEVLREGTVAVEQGETQTVDRDEFVWEPSDA